MDPSVYRRARREALSIQGDDVVSDHKSPAMVVSPAITRRPEVDSMLADMAIVAKMALERLRNKIMERQFLDRDEMREFKDLCETVLRQARVEMEVEDHVAKRTTSMSTEQIYQTIQSALRDADVDEKTTATVLSALGMTTPKSA